MTYINPTGRANGFDAIAADLEERRRLGWRPEGEEASEPAGPRRSSHFYSAADLEGRTVPPREWLVPDLIPMGTVTLFGGDGGTGKSLLAHQLAAACAASTPWLGLPVTSGYALLLSAEDDDDELHRRTDAIRQAAGLSYDDLGPLTLRSLAGEDALLAVDSGTALMATTLMAELHARAAAFKPSLIVLDTLADMFPANENDRTKVRQFVGLLRHLAIKHRCAVVLLAHPSLTGLSSGSGLSGSTAWNNSVRSRLYLERIADEGHEPDPNRRRLKTMKANYGPVGGELMVRWERGVFVPDGEAPKGLDRQAASAKAERVFLKLLDQFTADGRPVSANPSVTFAPSLFHKHPSAEGVTKRALTDAMNALFTRGAIAVETHGRASKERSRIVRKEGDHAS